MLPSNLRCLQQQRRNPHQPEHGEERDDDELLIFWLSAERFATYKVGGGRRAAARDREERNSSLSLKPASFSEVSADGSLCLVSVDLQSVANGGTIAVGWAAQT